MQVNKVLFSFQIMLRQTTMSPGEKRRKKRRFPPLKEGSCRKLMCQADIVGLVSGKSTIIITVNIRMRKY